MTACGDIRLELGGYVLRGLEPHEVAVVESHLASCDRCRREVDALAPLPDLMALAETAQRPAPDDLRQRTLRGVRRLRRRVPLTAVAAVALVAALAGAGVTGLADRPPTPDETLTLQAADPVGISGDAQLRQVASGVQVDLQLAGLRAYRNGYYHVWLHRGDHRVSAGTFMATVDGQADVRLLCGGRLPGYDRLTVTWHGNDRDDEVVAIDTELPA